MSVGLPLHPIRSALLDLMRERGPVTSTQAARELGGSSGLHSFHLRQLARAGLIEEVPGVAGRAKPWRLAAERPTGGPGAPDDAGMPDLTADQGAPNGPGAPDGPGLPDEPGLPDGLDRLNRDLEDDSYRHWLEAREGMPEPWRRDEAFSQVLVMTPEELRAMATLVRAAMQPYLSREADPALRPAGSAPVAMVVRLFPLGGAPAPPPDAGAAPVPPPDAGAAPVPPPDAGATP